MSDPADRIEADIVVVGGGGAGLAAAAEAVRLGARVVLLEKGDKLGGTTALSVGSIMAAGTQQQKAAGIADSPELHACDLDTIRRSMGFEDDAELRRLLTENVAETVEFLRSIGINFLGPLPQPPHTVARLHQVMPTSRAYVFQLSRYATRKGVRIVTSARATRLLTENGCVVGVEAKVGGKSQIYEARRGVIMTSGDIGANVPLMHKYMKNWSEGIEPYNPLNVGEGHLIAEAVGARIFPRKDSSAEVAAHIRFVRPADIWLQKVPPYAVITRAMVLAMNLLPERVIRPFMMRFLTTTLGPDRGVYEQGAILVNRNGERFADERNNPNLMIPRQPGGLAWIVFDEKFAQKFSRWPYFISTAPGVAFAFFDDYRRARPDLFNRGDTADALARRMGFAVEKFAATLASVNQSRVEEQKISQGPFYALGPVKLWVTVSPVGLAVNTRLEVLDQSSKPIPGLYAAGNAGQAGFTVTGHGHGLGWAFTTGRLAARAAIIRSRN